MDVQRRKAAKIFACFLSGRKRAENMNRATALDGSWQLIKIVTGPAERLISMTVHIHFEILLGS
jgi:hypothetical protein